MAAINMLRERLTELKFHGSLIPIRQMRKSLVDIYPSMLLRLNKRKRDALARPGQQLRFLDMPSYTELAVDNVTKVLNGRMIDALFIDGDHRYEGVTQDFLCYRPFVKEGGLILFHDIVEDNGRSRAWAGGVPKIWRDLYPYYHHCEFVASRAQQGFGIGVLSYSRAARPPIVRS